MATQGQARSNSRGGPGNSGRAGYGGVSGRAGMVGDVAPPESIGCLVGLLCSATIIAVLLPAIMFMYIDMKAIKKENEIIKSKIGKYTALIEKCSKD